MDYYITHRLCLHCQSLRDACIQTHTHIFAYMFFVSIYLL